MSCIGSVSTSNNASMLHITSSSIRFVQNEVCDFFKKRTSHKMHAVLFSFPLQNAKTFARSLNVLSVIKPCRLYLERNVFFNTGDFCMQNGRRIVLRREEKDCNFTCTHGEKFTLHATAYERKEHHFKLYWNIPIEKTTIAYEYIIF